MNLDLKFSPTKSPQAVEKISDARTQIMAGDLEAAKESALVGAEKLENAKIKAEDVTNERGLLWVLASVGTHMAAFVHEINALLGVCASRRTEQC